MKIIGRQGLEDFKAHPVPALMCAGTPLPAQVAQGPSMALGTFRDGAPKLLWGRGVIHRAVQITSGKAFQYSKCDLSATGNMQMHVGTNCTLVPWEKKKTQG